MKKCISLLALLCFLTVAGQASAYSISLAPSAQTVGTGGTASVNVDLAVAPLEELFGFDFDLVFNPAILNFQTLQFNPVLSGYLTGFTGPSADSPDLVTFDGGFFDGMFGLSEGNYTLATLTFDGIGQGISTLDLTGDVLDMNPESGLVPINASASVSVPEPATMLLLGFGLLGLAGAGRQRR